MEGYHFMIGGIARFWRISPTVESFDAEHVGLKIILGTWFAELFNQYIYGYKEFQEAGYTAY